jgi:hypothetical protein
MENIDDIKRQIKSDKDLPTVLKGISIEKYNNSNMITSKVGKLRNDSDSIYNLIVAFNKPISKCF